MGPSCITTKRRTETGKTKNSKTNGMVLKRLKFNLSNRKGEKKLNYAFIIRPIDLSTIKPRHQIS